MRTITPEEIATWHPDAARRYSKQLERRAQDTLLLACTDASHDLFVNDDNSERHLTFVRAIKNKDLGQAAYSLKPLVLVFHGYSKEGEPLCYKPSRLLFDDPKFEFETFKDFTWAYCQRTIVRLTPGAAYHWLAAEIRIGNSTTLKPLYLVERIYGDPIEALKHLRDLSNTSAKLRNPLLSFEEQPRGTHAYFRECARLNERWHNWQPPIPLPGSPNEYETTDIELLGSPNEYETTDTQ